MVNDWISSLFCSHLISKGDITSNSITLSCCLSQWVLVDLNLWDTHLEAAHYLKPPKTLKNILPWLILVSYLESDLCWHWGNGSWRARDGWILCWKGRECLPCQKHVQIKHIRLDFVCFVLNFYLSTNVLDFNVT